MASANKQPGARRWLMLTVVVALGLGMLRCTMPTELGIPSWDVPFTLAFNTQRYGLDSLVSKPEELALDSAGITRGENGELVFTSISELDPYVIDAEDMTSNNEQAITYDVETDTIVIPLNQHLSEAVELDDILSDFGIPLIYNDGDQLLLPPGGGDWTFPTASSEVTFSDLDTVRYVNVISGQLTLTLVNETNLAFDAMSVQLQRERIDQDGVYTGLTSFNFGAVGPNSSLVRTYTFDNDTLTAGLRLVIDGSGSQQLFAAFHDDEIRFDLDVGTLRSDFAEAVIGAQEPETNSDQVVLDEDLWIKSGLVQSGSLDWMVENETDVNSLVQLTFPQIYESEDSEDPFSITFDLDRRMTGQPAPVQEGSIDLSGYQIRFADENFPSSPGETQTLTTVTTVTIQGSGNLNPGDPGYYSRISVGDSVLTSFTVNDIVMERFRGVTRNLEFALDSQTQDIEFWDDQPDMQEDLGFNLSLADADLVLNLERTEGFRLPLQLSLTVTAENTRTNQTVTRNVNRVLQGEEQTVRINDLQNIVNIAPNRITVNGMAATGYEVFGVPDEPYQISQGDSLKGSIHLDAPLMLAVSEATPLRPAPQKFDSELEGDFASFRIAADVENRIALGGQLYLLGGIFPDSTTAYNELVRANADEYLLTYDSLVVNPEPLEIPAAPSVDGRATGITTVTINSLIPEGKFALFKEQNVWTRQILVLNPTPPGEFIVAHSKDYINVSIIGEVTYRVDVGGEEDVQNPGDVNGGGQ